MQLSLTPNDQQKIKRSKQSEVFLIVVTLCSTHYTTMVVTLCSRVDRRGRDVLS